MAKERVLTFGTAQQLGIRLPNMSANGGTQTVEIIPYESGGDFSFGSTQNNFKDYNFVQLIPYVKYTWSGPEVVMINQYHRGLGTGSVLSTTSVNNIGYDDESGIRLKSGSQFVVNSSSFSGQYLTYFKSISSGNSRSGALIYNSSKSPYPATRAITEDDLGTIYPFMFENISLSKNNECLVPSDMKQIKNTHKHSGINIQLNFTYTGNRWSSSSNAYSMPDGVIQALRTYLKEASGGPVPSWVRCEQRASGSVVSLIAGTSIPGSGTSYTWSGYYVLENTKGINGEAKGTYNIPITIKEVRIS